jgi:hypothetical protein
MKIPLKQGTLEIADASGRCVIDGCKIRGGGLLSIQQLTNLDSPADVLDAAWKGQKVVMCGDHFLVALSTILRLPDGD